MIRFDRAGLLRALLDEPHEVCATNVEYARYSIRALHGLSHETTFDWLKDESDRRAGIYQAWWSVGRLLRP